MPWLETDPMEQRTHFIVDHQRGLYRMTELCARYGISRTTGYKWLARFAEFGWPGLEDQSRAPHTCPHRIAADLEELLCDTRRGHPDWGAGKLLDYLRPRHDRSDWPVTSTVNDLLGRHGLLEKRPRRRPHVHPGSIPVVTTEPNDLWTTDFKGQFPTQDGVLCYPLTIADQHSRYLLTCQGRPSTHWRPVQADFTRAFRTYGLPRAMRTDNGVPFASSGLHGLSQLNVWWMRLGIQHQRIAPGQPQQNGSHERMHKTLKRGAIRPPRANARAQQRAFDHFRAEFNDERPHAALEGQTPGSLYHPSPRPYPRVLPPQEYPGHFLVRKVMSGGTFSFQGHLLFLASALSDHHLGLEETEDGIWSIYFNTVLLAKLDERDYIIHG